MNSTETSAPSGMNPRTKNMLVIMGIIGAIIIGALLIYGILVTPARQPYRDALAQFENVGRANATLTAAGSSLNASKATGEEFQKNIQTAQAALKSLKTENEALAKEDVLKDGEGKQKYEAYNEKLKEYMAYNENLLASMLLVRPVLVECNKDMTDITDGPESIAAIRSCAAQLVALKEIADNDYRVLIVSFNEDYTNLANILEQMATEKAANGEGSAQYKTLTSQRDEALDQLSITSTEFTNSLKQHRNQILTTDTEKKLADYLKDKSSVF